jgi:hypothetical protein
LKKEQQPQKKMEIFSIDIVFLIIIVVPVLIFLCILAAVCYFCRNASESRYQPPSIAGTLRYLKEEIFVREVIVENPKILTKREKRRVNIRHFVAAQIHPGDTEEEEEQDNLESGTMLDRMMRSSKNLFSSPSKKSITNGDSKKEGEKSSKGFFSWFSSKKEVSTKSQEISSKSKRFLSQDRLQRAEARKLLVKQKSIPAVEIEIKPEEKTENVSSLLDIESQITTKQQEIIASRKLKHSLYKASLKQQNPDYVDSIIVNAGPLPHELPSGYKMVHFIPDNLPETLLWKRCLYKIDGEKEKVNGWFLGTIGSVSKAENSNYLVKYDRKETKSLFVDGFRAVMLDLSGADGYGRKWILVEKIP